MNSNGGFRKLSKFKDKVVVVTGGARNTGLEIVDSFVPTGREATGKDVADAVLYLASDAARGFQGARLVMDGGSTVQLYPSGCEDDTSKMRQK